MSEIQTEDYFPFLNAFLNQWKNQKTDSVEHTARRFLEYMLDAYEAIKARETPLATPAHDFHIVNTHPEWTQGPGCRMAFDLVSGEHCLLELEMEVHDGMIVVHAGGPKHFIHFTNKRMLKTLECWSHLFNMLDQAFSQVAKLK